MELLCDEGVLQNFSFKYLDFGTVSSLLSFLQVLLMLETDSTVKFFVIDVLLATEQVFKHPALEGFVMVLIQLKT